MATPTKLGLVHVISTLLVLQYMLGMLANLYSTVPPDKPYLVFTQHGFIEFHAYNGVILLVLAAIYLVRSIKSKRHVKDAFGGLSGLVLAFACGELFVFTHVSAYSL